MSAAQKAFREYLKENFDEEFDPMDIRHLTFEGLFISGWDAHKEWLE